MYNYNDFIGKKINRWLITSAFHNGRETMFKCVCDCGTNKNVCARNIIHEKSLSCGCYRKTHLTTHKEATNRTKEYNIWSNIKSRCQNKEHRDYPNYGGRGIGVCKEWANSYELFLKDMGRAPSSKHSIDRIDNSKGYYLDNCRWATQKEQMRNTRRNNYITFNGKTKIIQDWANSLGIKACTLYKRLNNWSLERALTEKSNRYGNA